MSSGSSESGSLQVLIPDGIRRKPGAGGAYRATSGLTSFSGFRCMGRRKDEGRPSTLS